MAERQLLRRALALVSRTASPLEWAQTQNNLGNALQTLDDREGDAAQLSEAIAAYRAALTERTRERMPLEWARTLLQSTCAALPLAELLVSFPMTAFRHRYSSSAFA